MPTYDFLCLNCNQRFDLFLTYAQYSEQTPACPHCTSRNVRRRLNRVRLGRSDESRMEALDSDLGDPSSLAGLEDDPQEMGRMMRKMGREMGQDLPEEFEEVAGRLEKGQSPEQIEQEIPSLAALASDDPPPSGSAEIQG